MNYVAEERELLPDRDRTTPVFSIQGWFRAWFGVRRFSGSYLNMKTHAQSEVTLK